MTENELRYMSGSVHGKVLVVTILVKQIRDPETSYALRDEILLLADPAKTSHVVLDLQRVDFVGSVGLLAFLAVRRHLQGGQIVICNVSDSIRSMFEVCRLVSRDPSATAPFGVDDSVEAALARFCE